MSLGKSPGHISEKGDDFQYF